MEKCIFIVGLVLFIHDLADGFSLNNYQNNFNLTHRIRRQSGFKCTLPEHPANGQWRIIKGEGKPGDKIDINTILRIDCQEGYRLNPMLPLIACGPDWNPKKFPICEKKCPSFYTTATTILKCVDRNGDKINCDQAVDGTYLTYECIAFYEIPPGNSRSLYCREGTWDYSKPVCQPVCGRKITNQAMQLSYGGKVVKDLEYPWVVALFRKEGNSFTNICGGTLLNTKVIVTAAHCVTNEAGDTLSKDSYEVAAGQYYNAYKDPRDMFSQYKKVAEIKVKQGYRGSSQRYIADIAIIVVEGFFKLGSAVQPVCFNNQQNIILQPSQIGEVAGWGRTENHTAADRLRVIKVPFKDQATCSAELPAEWEEQYNVLDKICAGHYKKNISVCKGDSGSGLVFKNLEDGRYYIHGIVSIAPSLYNEECNFETNALYTSIKSYYDFIDLEMRRYYVEDCKLPPYPDNGKWSIVNGGDKNPGEVVLSSTVLQFSCNRGYKLSSNRELMKCHDILDIPTCDLLCPVPDFPKNTVKSCNNKKDRVIDCADATDGSSITYSCPAGFVTDQGTQSSTRYCFDGTYDLPRPDCLIAGTVHKPSTKPVYSNTASDGIKVICTYASWWAYEGVYPEDFDPHLCTHIVYQFIGVWDKGDVRVQDDGIDLDQVDRGLYNRITDLKKKNPKLKVLLSVGGTKATNTTLFRRISKHAAKTGAFLGSAGYFLKTYHFDGLDLDWQYPEEEDKENYKNFLQIIKDDCVRNNWLFSASVRPQLENTGYNVTFMNKILDWVTIKSYDFYGEWSNYTGIHNALYPSSKDYLWEKRHLNMDIVAKNWMAAGLSKEKLVLSIAFHGKSFTLKDPNLHGNHDPITGPGPGVDGGFIRYYQICSQHKTNYIEEWDDDTKSVFKYKDNVWMSFNTKDAVWTRAEYIKKSGYAGVNVFPLDGDDNKGVCGMKHILLKHVHGGLGHAVDWDN